MFSKFWRSNNDAFTEIFKNHIDNTAGCADDLQRLFEDLPHAAEHVARIIEREHQGDRLTLETHLLHDRTFITRIDKEDIIKLIDELDDVIDYMRIVAIRVKSFHVTGARSEAKNLATVITTMTRTLQHLIGELPTLKLRDLQPEVQRVKALEEEADAILHQALENIFNNEGDPKTVMKWMVILDLLEKVTDHCEDVVDVISSIVRKSGR